MSLNIPDLMPILSAGAHEGPEQGACIMEMASFLAGEKWTDFPTCTNEFLARAAQYANDQLGDGERQLLLPLLPRLMGTSDRSDDVNWAIAQAAADYVRPLIGHSDYKADYYARVAQTDLTRHNPAWPTLDAHTAITHSKGDFVAYLSHLIDAYDKAAGRTEAATVTEDDLRRCAELTGATR